ncbi:hypothetical protein GWO43_25980, partial [candidate division KSB1 bacterium]|nr:hypothetical protein [candidate division KSB1 bacterium]NIR69261.1 hypothetical protein [candidate division KSB1 bacterium]NIS27434.1 hypothetical protein [candidate division KSB1 bacterium]NIT74260.1 hypothetical protein [candidate division KSB1 bacterium]NIU28152.1 hypothetical protein [candidate division KSB1 bacterium]
MENKQLNTSILHCTIIKNIIDKGYAPELPELTELFDASEDEILRALQRLQDEHGVVLHPNSAKIWVVHPFSLAPTNFLLSDGEMEWWCNCAWCSLGAAALLARDVTITTTIGANDRQIKMHITSGQVVETGLYVHFPIPMHQAWDNVIYTCST